MRDSKGVEHEKAENLNHLRCLKENYDLSLGHIQCEQVDN